MFQHRICILLFISLFIGASVVSVSAVADERSDARKHYSAGMVHYNLREYSAAADEFQAAYRLVPDPSFLYNLAQTHRLMGHERDALYFYQAYLRARPEAENRADVDERIAKLKESIAAHNAEPSGPQKPVISEGTTTSPASTTNAVTAGAPPRKTPLYKKWWLWTAVGVVAVGVGVGLGVGLGERRNHTYPLVSF
jgi:iron complex outermembrane receptor protein